jgi:xanthine dehydrogenase YagS FAD-binding subunit
MKSFTYILPKTMKEASKALGLNWEEALPYAGGTDLYGMVKSGLVSPKKLVNLKVLSGMDKIEYSPKTGLKIGPLVKISDISSHEVIKQKYQVLAEAASEVASPQLRNMGTIGGNICQRPRCWYFRGDFYCLRKGGEICYAVGAENKFHCIIGGDPCYIVHPSDTAVALLALDAKVTVTNSEGKNTIPLNEFFVLPKNNVHRENILLPGDVISSITIPILPKNSSSAYIKVKERGAWDFAIVSIAAVIQASRGMIHFGKIVFGGVAPIPWLDKNLSAQLKNLAISKQNLDKLTESVLRSAYPLNQNAYKHILAKNLARRILTNLGEN